MEKSEFLSAITEIGSLEDIVEVRTKLSELSDNVSNIFDENSQLSESNRRFEEDNEKLRSANMQLFLKVGEPNKKVDDLGDPKQPERIEESFEELYNKKG